MVKGLRKYKRFRFYKDDIWGKLIFRVKKSKTLLSILVGIFSNKRYYRKRLVRMGLKKRKRRKRKTWLGVDFRMKKKFFMFYSNVRENQMKKFLIGVGLRNLGLKTNFFGRLESRLDVCLYRLFFTKTMQESKKLIGLGNVYVNNRLVDRSSYLLKPGDLITLKDNDSLKKNLIDLFGFFLGKSKKKVHSSLRLFLKDPEIRYALNVQEISRAMGKRIVKGSLLNYDDWLHFFEGYRFKNREISFKYGIRHFLKTKFFFYKPSFFIKTPGLYLNTKIFNEKARISKFFSNVVFLKSFKENRFNFLFIYKFSLEKLGVNFFNWLSYLNFYLDKGKSSSFLSGGSSIYFSGIFFYLSLYGFKSFLFDKGKSSEFFRFYPLKFNVEDFYLVRDGLNLKKSNLNSFLNFFFGEKRVSGLFKSNFLTTSSFRSRKVSYLPRYKLVWRRFSKKYQYLKRDVFNLNYNRRLSSLLFSKNISYNLRFLKKDDSLFINSLYKLVFYKGFEWRSLLENGKLLDESTEKFVFFDVLFTFYEFYSSKLGLYNVNRKKRVLSFYNKFKRSMVGVTLPKKMFGVEDEYLRSEEFEVESAAVRSWALVPADHLMSSEVYEDGLLLMENSFSQVRGRNRRRLLVQSVLRLSYYKYAPYQSEGNSRLFFLRKVYQNFFRPYIAIKNRTHHKGVRSEVFKKISNIRSKVLSSGKRKGMVKRSKKKRVLFDLESLNSLNYKSLPNTFSNVYSFNSFRDSRSVFLNKKKEKEEDGFPFTSRKYTFSNFFSGKESFFSVNPSFFQRYNPLHSFKRTRRLRKRGFPVKFKRMGTSWFRVYSRNLFNARSRGRNPSFFFKPLRQFSLSRFPNVKKVSKRLKFFRKYRSRMKGRGRARRRFRRKSSKKLGLLKKKRLRLLKSLEKLSSLYRKGIQGDDSIFSRKNLVLNSFFGLSVKPRHDLFKFRGRIKKKLEIFKRSKRKNYSSRSFHDFSLFERGLTKVRFNSVFSRKKLKSWLRSPKSRGWFFGDPYLILRKYRKNLISRYKKKGWIKRVWKRKVGRHDILGFFLKGKAHRSVIRGRYVNSLSDRAKSSSDLKNARKFKYLKKFGGTDVRSFRFQIRKYNFYLGTKGFPKTRMYTELKNRLDKRFNLSKRKGVGSSVSQGKLSKHFRRSFSFRKRRVVTRRLRKLRFKSRRRRKKRRLRKRRSRSRWNRLIFAPVPRYGYQPQFRGDKLSLFYPGKYLETSYLLLGGIFYKVPNISEIYYPFRFRPKYVMRFYRLL